MLLKRSVILLFWGLAGMLAAQVPTHEYFPVAQCKSADVKTVTVFETRIDDPVAQAGKGNRIRLARNMVRQNQYDREGQVTRTLHFENEGRTLIAEVLRTYDAEGRLSQETQHRFNTNFLDSTRIIQSHLRHHRYVQGTKLLSASLHSLTNTAVVVPVDSTAFVRDAQGKLLREAVYSLRGGPNSVLEKEYVYEGRAITVLSKVGDQVLNRDLFELDGQGRITKESNFGPGDETPRLVTNYIYDPRGWLQELRFEPDWQHFTKSATVVSRKNRYDDHGKLVEVQLDFGDGKRMFEFYDYSYWVEN